MKSVELEQHEIQALIRHYSVEKRALLVRAKNRVKEGKKVSSFSRLRYASMKERQSYLRNFIDGTNAAAD